MPAWITSLKRVLCSEYLQQRADAFANREHMDPVLADFMPEDPGDQIDLWLAFMAGSDWEREHRGRRYTDEMTIAN